MYPVRLSFEPRTMEQADQIVHSAINSAMADPRSEYMLVIADIETDELIGSSRLALGEYESGQIMTRDGGRSVRCLPG